MRSDQRKKSRLLLSVKSREQLLLETNDKVYVQKIRRTKIVCSVSDKTNNYEMIKNMIHAGANSFNLNMAYCKNKNAIKIIASLRDRLESELNTNIPLNLMLKGKQVRVGALKRPEIFLKKGHTIRLTQDKRVVGDAHIIPVDDEDFFNSVHRGDKIVMDYGQVVVSVEGKEDSEQATKYLMETYPEFYPNQQSFRQREQYEQGSGQSNSETNPEFGHQQISSSQFLEPITPIDMIQEETSQNNMAISQEISQQSEKKKKFADALKKKKEIKQKQKFQILVCTIQGDCLLRPLRPVFLLNDADWLNSPTTQKKKIGLSKSYSNFSDTQKIKEQKESSEDSDEDSQITTQDINYIRLAKKYDFDSITISNIHRLSELQEVFNLLDTLFIKLRDLMGRDTRMKVLVRITTKEAVDNFAEIVKSADGCILARAYLAVQSVIEGVVQQQLDMIKLAHQSLKPIIISSQILESMISSMIPTFSEMGDISNLVNEDVDSIILTGETTYGGYPIQTISTLDRVSRQIEQIQRLKRSIHFSEIETFTLVSNRHIIANTVAQATVDAAYRIDARLIVVVTSSGSTALKISKLKPPCSILAITSGHKIARQLQIVGGIIGVSFGTLYGSDALFSKALDYSRNRAIIQKGDFIVLLSGQVENVSGHLNTVRIVQI